MKKNNFYFTTRKYTKKKTLSKFDYWQMLDNKGHKIRFNYVSETYLKNKCKQLNLI